MPQTLSEIKGLLAGHGLRPKKRLGQNFLHDANQMSRIVEAAAIESGELVLEVGAATGSLSLALLEAGATLVAVEMDRDLEPILRHVLAGYPRRATCVIADVLAGKHTVNPSVIEALRQTSADGKTMNEFKLVANLPYNIASPLLANLVMDWPQMTCGVIMIQREVADRLTANPGHKDYGPLGIVVGAMCHVERLYRLGPGCFWPRPKVDSAVVRLRRRQTPLTDQPHALAQLLRRLFGKRRKQLGTILGRDTPLPDGIDPNARPEQLTPDQLVSLADWLS